MLLQHMINDLVLLKFNFNPFRSDCPLLLLFSQLLLILFRKLLPSLLQFLCRCNQLSDSDEELTPSNKGASKHT